MRGNSQNQIGYIKRRQMTQNECIQTICSEKKSSQLLKLCDLTKLSVTLSKNCKSIQ